MTTILGISGSLRRASFNTSLLRAAEGLVPEGVVLESATLHGIPLYDGDVEAEQGSPAAVSALKERIVRADGLLLVTPEYNNGIPGVFKNAIDWLSRPPADMARVFARKRVGLIGATPGPGGTLLSQAGWLPVLRTLGVVPFFGGRLNVSHASKVFDGEGKLVDETVRAQLAKFLTAFSEFVT
jgi:chromate reductase, NAD(P)H dehydrogenase (quinone)